MKTKLFILFAAIAFTFGTASVYAEGDGGTSAPTFSDDGKVTLNVKIHPIQTIEINTASKVIDLEYKTKENFSAGVSYTAQDHLKIYSTSGFAVNVKTNGDLKRAAAVAGDKVVESSGITLEAENGTQSLAVGSFTPAILSNDGNNVQLFSSEFGGVDKTFNVKYTAAKENKYINHYVKGENPTIYTTELTYTIVAQ